MKIAMLNASWEKFGEPWSTPQGVRSEFLSRGHEVKDYNLYHDDGVLLPGRNIRAYSNQGINILYQDFVHGRFVPDMIFLMDYGPWDSLQFDKKYFPGVMIVKECGDEPQAHRSHFAAAPRVHMLLSPDRECVEKYRTFGYNAHYWTHHADQRLFYPRPDIEVKYDCVTTCGPRGTGLTEEISAALGDRFNNERYFHGKDHAERLCMGNIVFQHSQYKEVTRRVFEGMACGKMILTDRLPEETGMSEMFTDGEDIVYYDDAQDAIDKIKHYTDNTEERERIALNGYNKVMAEHTVTRRVDQLEECFKETVLV